MNLQRAQSASLQQFSHRDDNDAAALPAGNTLSSGGEERPFFRLDFLRSLQLHSRLALGIALVGVGMAVANAVKMWPVYTAQSQVYIQPVAPKVMDQGNQPRWPYDSNSYDSYIQQQVQSATNTEVLINALHKLGPGAWLGNGESEQSAARRLGQSIEAARVGTSYEVSIIARAADPELAAQIANAVASSIVDRASGEETAGDIQRLAILREERTRVQNELDADRAEQDALNKQLGMAAVGITTPDLIDDDIGRTREELIKARTDHDVAAARFTAMEAGNGASAAINSAADELIASDPGLNSMKTSLNQRRAILITQMANLTSNNPEYKQDAEELAKINSTLDSMMNDLRSKAASRIQQGLRTDLARTAGVEAQLNGQLRQLAGTAASATPKLQRAGDLATDIVRLRTRYSSVDEQLHDLMLQDSVPGAVHLSVVATPPTHPTISGILRKTLPMALGGLFLAILAALIANNLDPRVYIVSDIEQVLGFAPMAVLPDFTEVSDEVAAEHLLRISAVIEQACKQGMLKSAIFTGPGPGTGVTTVATKVREMLEAMGRATVLVDALGTPPTAARTNAAGSGQSESQSLVVAQRGSRSTALLEKVAQETETQTEGLVLTDTAPLLVSAETAYLARYVDSVIVVIESGVTTRAQLREVVATLQRLNVAAAGFVLNRVGLAKADSRFRQSVHAVERHLRSQGRSTARRTVRSRPLDSVAACEGSNNTQEAAIRIQSQPPVPAPASERNVSLSSLAVAQRFDDSAEQEPVLKRFDSLVQAQESHEPKPKQDTGMPWWLADSRPPINVPESAAIPQGARMREPEMASAYQPVPSRREPGAPPARFWDRVSGRAEDIIPASSVEEAHHSEDEVSSYDAVSTLSGLRSLIFPPRLKKLDNAQRSSAQDSEPVPPSDPSFEDQDHARIHKAPPELAPALAASARSVRSETLAKVVTAQPEFLPPKSLVVTIDEEQAEQIAATTRHDRRDAFDDVEILPSWRGQYRKKD
jgi:uncharacterized protein involved in exopolysaccharide biosynthesis/Mrp family chromosome partitioning ATPase